MTVAALSRPEQSALHPFAQLDPVGWGSGLKTETVLLAQANGPALHGRPDLRAIERNYQVREDTVQSWSPRAFGAVPIPFAPSRELTSTEGRLLNNLTRDRGLLGLQRFSDIADQAFAVSDARYPAPARIPAAAEAQIRALPPEQQPQARAQYAGNDGHRDAFRHTYWNALLAREFGAAWTQQFTTAHEALPGNNGLREAMDLYNNEVGRAIAVANPDATPEQLANLVGRALDEGRLVVVNSNGRLEWSDRVPFGQHGIAPPEPRPGVIGVPAGDASAQPAR